MIEYNLDLIMRLHRSSARFPRAARRRSGCASFILLTLLVCGVSFLTWRLLDRQRTPPGSTSDAFADAGAAYARGDLDGAAASARRALTARPDRIEAGQILVRALIYRSYAEINRTRDRELALAAAADLLARLPGRADALALYAFALQAAGDPYNAADAARQALDIAPDDALARTALALAYSMVGAHEAAMQQSAQAVRDAIDTATRIDALRALAIAHRDRGDYAQAIALIDGALRLNDRLLALHFERAAYAMQLGDTNAATVSYYQVLVYAPDNIKARFRLCELSTILREHDAAVSYCNEVIERLPGWADGWYQLGREYFLHGDFREAQAHFQQCARLQTIQRVPVQERRFECWYLQGQAALINGDCPALREIYREFQTMDIDDAVKQTWVYPPEGPPGCPFADP